MPLDEEKAEAVLTPHSFRDLVITRDRNRGLSGANMTL